MAHKPSKRPRTKPGGLCLVCGERITNEAHPACAAAFLDREVDIEVITTPFGTVRLRVDYRTTGHDSTLMMLEALIDYGRRKGPLPTYVDDEHRTGRNRGLRPAARRLYGGKP